jgi:hypothetical protein
MAKKLTIEEKIAQILAEAEVEDNKVSVAIKKDKKEKLDSIEVIGDMYECNYISLSKSEFQDLKKNGMESLIWEDNMEELMGNSYINGYVFDQNNAYFHIEINGVENSKIISDFIKNKKNHFKHKAGSKKKNTDYFLVFEKWTKQGLMSKKVNKFNEDKLQLAFDDCSIPCVSINRVVSIVYKGDYLDFDTSSSVQESLYIYSSEGEKIELNY